MKRQISKLKFFMAGDPEKDAPSQAFFTYNVGTSRAFKTGNVHVVKKLSKTETVLDTWKRGVEEIKKLEGVA